MAWGPQATDLSSRPRPSRHVSMPPQAFDFSTGDCSRQFSFPLVSTTVPRLRLSGTPPKTAERVLALPSLEERPRTAWAKILEFMGDCAFAICFCEEVCPFAHPTKDPPTSKAPLRDIEVGKDRRQSWYSVRPPPRHMEVFTVRAISNPQEGNVLKEISSFDMISNIIQQKPVKDFLPKHDEDGRDCSDLDIFSKRPRGRSQSVPNTLERYWGIPWGDSAELSRDEMMCKLCFSEAADVVLLPCRHGGLCYRCFRRMLFMRPVHRGGSTCPMCRRPIREAVRITEGELKKSVALAQYGVGIDC